MKARRATAASLVIVAGAALGLTACSSGTQHAVRDVSVRPAPGAALAPTTVVPDPTVPAPTTTTAAPAPVAARPASAPATPLPGLGPGSRGPAVAALEQRLSALDYYVGAVDGVYDGNTAYGVTAFQKVNGLPRSGRATDDVIAALESAKSPAPLVPGGGATRVEIDLTRQVLFLYQGDNLSKILPVSTGSGARFCSQGSCRRAITNTGSFAIYSKHTGWETSPLGRLYNSQYFDGGIAIHGSPSVPPTPVSHGCVRIPMGAADWFPSQVPLGTPVYVVGSGGAPPPLAPTPAPSTPVVPQAPSAPAPTPTIAPPITFVAPTTSVP